MYLATEKHPDGTIAAFALLGPPIRLFGKVQSQILAAGTDGTVDARVLFGRVKLEARAAGIEVLIGSTYRNAKAMARMFGGTVGSTNVRWDL